MANFIIVHKSGKNSEMLLNVDSICSIYALDNTTKITLCRGDDIIIEDKFEDIKMLINDVALVRNVERKKPLNENAETNNNGGLMLG